MNNIKDIIDKISKDIKKYTFINHILLLIRTLKYILINPNERIAVIGKNSTGWIIVFWASILGKMPIVIIDREESQTRIIDILNKNMVSTVFMDENIFRDKLENGKKSIIEKLIFTRIIFGIPHISSIVFKLKILCMNSRRLINSVEEYVFMLNRIDILKRESVLLDNDKDYFIHTIVDNFVYKNESLEEELLKITKEEPFDDSDICVISFSPGVTNSKSFTDGIEITVSELIASGNKFGKAFEYMLTSSEKRYNDSEIVVFTKFSQWFPFLVFLGFLNNLKLCTFWKGNKNLKYVIFDTKSFENFWKESFETVFQNKYLKIIYLLFPFIYRIYIKNKFYKIFGKNIQEVIILNCMIRDNILYNLNKCNLPITTTYGTCNTGYISTINRKNIFRSVGKPIDKNTIYISPTVGICSINEKLDSYIYTDDVGYYDFDGELVIKGKAGEYFWFNNKPYYLQQIEKLIKSLPFVDECIIEKIGDKTIYLTAMIELNINIYNTDTLENKINNVLVFSKLKEKINKLLKKQIGLKIDSFSFINNMLDPYSMTDIPKALNGMPKLYLFR